MVQYARLVSAGYVELRVSSASVQSLGYSLFNSCTWFDLRERCRENYMTGMVQPRLKEEKSQLHRTLRTDDVKL